MSSFVSMDLMSPSSAENGRISLAVMIPRSETVQNPSTEASLAASSPKDSNVRNSRTPSTIAITSSGLTSPVLLYR